MFQNSKCALSGSALELPAVHFLCGHSFNVRSLGDNERECPLCAPQFRTILDIRRSIRTSATEQVLPGLSQPCLALPGAHWVGQVLCWNALYPRTGPREHGRSFVIWLHQGEVAVTSDERRTRGRAEVCVRLCALGEVRGGSQVICHAFEMLPEGHALWCCNCTSPSCTRKSLVVQVFVTPPCTPVHNVSCPQESLSINDWVCKSTRGWNVVSGRVLWLAGQVLHAAQVDSECVQCGCRIFWARHPECPLVAYLRRHALQELPVGCTTISLVGYNVGTR